MRGAVLVGSAICFGLNGLSFLAVIAGLMILRVEHTPPRTRQPLVDELRGGLDYVRGERVIVMLTVLAFVATFLGLPLLTFLPVFAQMVFNSDVSHHVSLSDLRAVIVGKRVAVGGVVAIRGKIGCCRAPA